MVGNNLDYFVYRLRVFFSKFCLKGKRRIRENSEKSDKHVSMLPSFFKKKDCGEVPHNILYIKREILTKQRGRNVHITKH
jgi:hypothetical protein